MVAASRAGDDRDTKPLPEPAVMLLILFAAVAIATLLAAAVASQAEPGGLSGPTVAEHWATR